VAGLGLNVRPDRFCAERPLASRVNVPCPVEFPAVPVTVTCWVVVTGNVRISNWAATWPSGMMIWGTTFAAVLDVLSDTAVPPAGAGDPMTTEPVEKPPPVTLLGDTVISIVGFPFVSNDGGMIMKLPCVPPSVVMVTTVG